MDTALIITAIILTVIIILHKPYGINRLPLITRFHVATQWKFYITLRRRNK